MKLSPNTTMPVLLILHFLTPLTFAQSQDSLNVRVVSILPEEGITGLVIRDGYIYAPSWYGFKIIDVRNP